MKFLKSTYIVSVLYKAFLLALPCFFIFSHYIKAQKVSVAIDRDKILIGEQVTLQLKAEDINPGAGFLQNWFSVYDSSKHIEVVKREPVDTIQIAGSTTYIQRLVITSFDSGKWKIPPLQVVLQNRATGEKSILQTDSVFLDVLPVDVSDMRNYHDIKDIIEVEAKPDYTLYFAIAVTAIILAVIAGMIIRQIKNKKPQPVQAIEGTALEIALREIKELREQHSSLNGHAKLFYTKLSIILRKYFDTEINIRSSQATSDELMILLGVYLQTEPVRSNFYQMLRLTDAVKFAKYVPGEEQNDSAVQTATASLQHIDILYRGLRSNA